MAGIMTTENETVPLSVFADRPLRLAPEDYPNSAWTEQTTHYNKMWSYYKGYSLNARDAKNRELYPVKLNIVRSAVINHAAVLMGQFSDDGVVQFSIKNTPGIDKELANNTAIALNMLWTINNGDDLFLENSLLQMVFGGAFLKVAWHPLRKKYPIRYFTVDPRACFPVWDGDDYNRLVSIDVHHQIPRPTAISRYRMPFREGQGVIAETEPIDYVSVHEHWDEKEYFIKYDDQIGQWPDGSPTQGDNPFMDPVLGLPIIPYVYTPRLRAGEFWGDSIVPGLIGPQDEINDDLAHLNEGLADAMHQQPWVRDRAKGTQGLAKNRNEWLNLGMTPPGSKNPPEAGRLAGADLNQSMTNYVVRDLIMLAREHANMPDIAYGRTDASIRSALTLKYMMWPAINVGLHYRRNNATALKQAAYMALVMAYSKRQFNSSVNGVRSLGIDSVTPEMIEAVLLGHKTNYPPMLPDDRAELVQEVMQRLTAALISPETAIRRLDGSSELEEELNKIDEHRKKMAEIEEKAADEAHRRNLEVQTKQAENRASTTTGDKKPIQKPKASGTRPQAEGGRAEGE